MSLWGHLSRGVRRLVQPAAADRDVADELTDYTARLTEEFVRSGMTPEEARRRARLEVGSPLAARDMVRQHGWDYALGTLLADARHAVRLLWRRPAFAAVTVLTLGLGVGATTAVFSVVYPILFQPLPYPGADRVVLVSQRNSAEGDLGRMGFTTMSDLAPGVPAFEYVAASDRWSATLTGTGEPEIVPGELVTWQFFRTLGITPAAGRDFRQDEDVPNAPTVLIISDGLWRRRFAADQTVIGRAIHVNGQLGTVIGVLPPGFESPLVQDAEIWSPRGFDVNSAGACRFCRHMQVMARLRANTTIAEAGAQLERLYQSLKRQYADTYREATFPVTPLRDYIARDVRGVLLTVLGAVGLVLLIASVNVTNLLLARGAERRAEFALRTALGAGRARLARQMLTESIVIALIGGATGVGIALLGVPSLLALVPSGMPRAAAIGVNGAVLTFALVLTTLVGVGFGLVPAVHVARERLADDMQGAARRVAGARRTRGVLVVAEVALALMLLVGSGLLLRSLQRVFAVPPGFDPNNVLTMRLPLADARFTSTAVVWNYYDQVLAAVRAVPGVESAGLTSQLPLSGDLDQYGIHGEVEAGGSSRTEHPGFRYAVSDGYLETLRIPIIRGRDLSASVASGELAAVINETAARAGWRGKDPIGQRVHVGPDQGPWYTIVGIARDVRQASLLVPPDNEIYVPERGGVFGDVMSLVVRTKTDPAAMTAALRRAIWSVDPGQALERVATMAALHDRSAAKQRFALVLFEVFGVVALVLAAAGIYGVLAGRVAERTREIGIRSALGASRSATLLWVLKQGAVLTGVGTVIGLASAAGLSRGLASLLFETTPFDPLIYGAVTVVLGAVALVACLVPAMRAARIDPAITLRAE